MKKTTMIVLTVLTLIGMSYIKSNYVDVKCVQDCMADGYMYGYCQKICSY